MADNILLYQYYWYYMCIW